MAIRRFSRPSWSSNRERFRTVCAKYDVLAETDGWHSPLDSCGAKALREHIADVLTRGAKHGNNYFKNTPQTIARCIGALDLIVTAEIERHDNIVPLKRRLNDALGERTLDARIEERLATRKRRSPAK